MSRLSRDMQAKLTKQRLWPRYHLTSEISSGGHEWQSRGLVRLWLNWIDQTPFWLLMMISYLLGFGLVCLVRALCR